MTVATWTQPNYTTQSNTAYKTNIDGGTSVLHGIAGAFAPHESSAGSPLGPDMTVTLDAGRLLYGSTLIEQSSQTTGTITAPATTIRSDLVVIDNQTGVVSVITGSESTSPLGTDPSITAGKIPIARINLTPSTTSITNSIIDDLRGMVAAYVIGTDVQAYDAGLTDISGLAVTDGNIIVGNGANWVAESGATARASLGLVIDTDVQGVESDVSGYVKGQTVFIEGGVGADSTGFDIATNISTAWESVGPTGSGATNIWTALNNVTSSSKWVKLKINHYVADVSATSLISTVYARKTGDSSAADSRTAASELRQVGASSAVKNGRVIDTIEIPVDSSNRFDLYANKSAGSTFTIVSFLVGWGV